MNDLRRRAGHRAMRIPAAGLALLVAVLTGCGERERIEGWPTYKHDAARTGATSQKLRFPLSLRWRFTPPHAPVPAWPAPGEERARSHLDNTHHVCAGSGMVYFGSPVDNKVYALDARTGEIAWTFFTEGPVRFAPTFWNRRIYFGSDDGFVYCLRSTNGDLLWKYRPGPSGERLLGNGRMISRWPVRTGVLVDDGVAYVGAGVFPYEGIYVCALNAADGSEIWKNDSIGDQAYSLAFGGISPQAPLVASKDRLYVSTGRSLPAAFDRETGEFIFYANSSHIGGAWSLVDSDNLITGVDRGGEPGKVVFDGTTGDEKEDAHAWFPGIDIVVTPEFSFLLTESGVAALDRKLSQEIVQNVRVIHEVERLLKERLVIVLYDIPKHEGDKRRKLIEERDDLNKKLRLCTEGEHEQKARVRKWECPVRDLNNIIVADKMIVGGGKDFVTAVDSVGRKVVWRAEVEGRARGLAVAGGRLFVSTDRGAIYCFGEGKPGTPQLHEPDFVSHPFGRDPQSGMYASAAERILNETGKTRGYCLVLGSGRGRLAYELARRTELKVVGIDSPGEADGTSRGLLDSKRRLDESGLHGSRIVLEPWALESLPDCFADLIVSDSMLESGTLDYDPDQIFRVLKPYGGIVCLGTRAKAESPAGGTDRDRLGLRRLADRLKAAGAVVTTTRDPDGHWTRAERGALAGAGNWTSQFANPQNTACSGDRLVKGPLGVLWFGEPGGQHMLDRHAKAVGPVAMDGRLFVQGGDVVMAYDAFNGTELWSKEVPGAVRARADVDGGNLALTRDGLYVATGERCIRFDPGTGQESREFVVPPTRDGSARRWGYVACANGMLYGSRALPLRNGYLDLIRMLVSNGQWRDPKEIPDRFRGEYEDLKSLFPVPDNRMFESFRRSGYLWRRMADYPLWEIQDRPEGALTHRLLSSDMVFGVDVETGKLVWKHAGNRIAHVTVTLGDSKLFYTDLGVSPVQKQRALQDREQLIRTGVYQPSGEKVDVAERDIREVVCLDAVSGHAVWRKPVDLTECGGDVMGAAYQNGVLLIFSNTGSHHVYDFTSGKLKWKRITALSADDGTVLWSHACNYRTRPVIIGDRIIIEPRACDVRTGNIAMRSHPITGRQVPWEFLRPGHACSITSASAETLFYRSFSTAFCDVRADSGLVLFGGARPGCLINMIPASGVLLYPEASAGCTCSFPIRCSLALRHQAERPHPWSVFISHAPKTPAKHFAINVGAPADRKDRDGTVWFAYPRPDTNGFLTNHPNFGIKFDLEEEIIPGLGFFSEDDKGVVLEGTNKPWLFTSGCVGLRYCEIPLVDDVWGEEPGVYTVRLGFKAPASDRPGQRRFTVRVQGSAVLKDLDIREAAGAPGVPVIRECRGVRVENALRLEFVAETADPSLRRAPLINFIEIRREDAPAKEEEIPPPRAITGGRDDPGLERRLQQAWAALNRKEAGSALTEFHAVLDGATSKRLILEALKGLSRVKSEDSLKRLARYCRDTHPVLWDYREPDEEIKNAAMAAFLAIAEEVAKSDPARAARMRSRARELAAKTEPGVIMSHPK